MTDLENKVHEIDKRQESFETFIKEHIKRLDDTIARIDKRIDRVEERLDHFDAKFDILSNQLHNAIVGGAIGIATIVITVILTR